MTDEISFPPLFEVPPRQLEAQKAHLLSAIASEPERRRSALPTLARLRLPFAVPAAAAICAVALVVVVLTGGQTRRGNGTVVNPAQSPPLALRYVRRNGVLTAIPLTVTAFKDAKVRLKVVRGTTQPRAVFERGGRVHKLIPSKRRGRSVARFAWSIVLRPNDWNGGCKHARYRVEVLIWEPHAGTESNSTSFFSCRS